jgi:hypothetical protein
MFCTGGALGLDGDSASADVGLVHDKGITESSPSCLCLPMVSGSGKWMTRCRHAVGVLYSQRFSLPTGLAPDALPFLIRGAEQQCTSGFIYSWQRIWQWRAAACMQLSRFWIKSSFPRYVRGVHRQVLVARASRPNFLYFSP